MKTIYVADDGREFNNPKQCEEYENKLKRTILFTPKSKVWKPNNSETYYCLTSSHGIEKFYWNNDDYDQYAFSLGNCFRTKKEAQFEVERLKCFAQWKRLSIESGEADNPWDNEHEHWIPIYDNYNRKLVISQYSSCRFCNVCFASEENIKNAINEIGEENVKRYILGVKE